MNANWTNGFNWQGLTPPLPGDDLVFPNGASRLSNANDFPSGTQFRSITFSGPNIAGYDLTGNAIVLTNGILENETGSTAVSFEDRVELNQITLGASQTFTSLTPNYGTLSVYTPVNLNGFTLTLDTGTAGFSRAFLGDAVSGSGAIVKIGTGWWFQFGHNTYSGPTDIRQGALVIESNDALGSTGQGTTVEDGASLVVQFVPVQIAEPITLFGTGGGSGAINVYADDTEFSGTLTLGSPTLIHATTLTPGSSSSTKLTGSVNSNGFRLTLDGELDTTLLGVVTGTGQVYVRTNRVLNGTGTVGGLIYVDQGQLSPGLNGPGVITSGGAFFSPAASFQVSLNGTAAGQFSRLDSNGDVDLNGSILNVTLNFTPAPGDAFPIINSAAAINGTFSGLPDGATLTIAGQAFVIHYVGPGTGHLQASSQVILQRAGVAAGGGGGGGGGGGVPASGSFPLPTSVFVTAADAGGGPDVKIFTTAGAFAAGFFAFDSGFTGGVRVAVGDVNGDGYPDIVCAAGPGGGPNVVVFSGLNRTEICNFFAFDMNFTGGCYVACGDVNGDGFADIIIGADAGGGPNVTVFAGGPGVSLSNQPVPVLSYFPYDIGFTGGVRVATGDVTATGRAAIVTGAGPGGGPNVTIYQLVNGQPQVLQSYFAYDSSLAAGLFVGAGDVNGDGHADIIAGTGALNAADAQLLGAPMIAVFSGADASPLSRFAPFAAPYTGAVRVAATDRTGTGMASVIAVHGPGGTPDVDIYDGLSGQLVDSFFAYDPNFTGGLYLANTGR